MGLAGGRYEGVTQRHLALTAEANGQFDDHIIDGEALQVIQNRMDMPRFGIAQPLIAKRFEAANHGVVGGIFDKPVPEANLLGLGGVDNQVTVNEHHLYPVAADLRVVHAARLPGR